MTKVYSAETWAVAPASKAKCAALFFDKIWVPSTLYQKVARNAGDSFFDFGVDQPPVEVGLGGRDTERRFLAYALGFDDSEVGGIGSSEDYAVLQGIPNAGRMQAWARHNLVRWYQGRGQSIVNLFESEDEFESVYPAGDRTVWLGAINNVPVVSNDALEWRQVLEFRQDKEAREKYRRLRLWINDGVEATSVAHATDLIGQKLADYEWSLKKHGLKSSLGVFGGLFDVSAAILAAGAGTIATKAGYPILGVAVAGLLLAGKTAATVWQSSIDGKTAIKGDPNCEIAFIHDAKQFLERVPK